MLTSEALCLPLDEIDLLYVNESALCDIGHWSSRLAPHGLTCAVGYWGEIVQHRPATAEDVRQAYRRILGREAESDDVVQARVGMPTWKLHEALISSTEFLRKKPKRPFPD
jgi:hypothetical protein